MNYRKPHKSAKQLEKERRLNLEIKYEKFKKKYDFINNVYNVYDFTNELEGYIVYYTMDENDGSCFVPVIREPDIYVSDFDHHNYFTALFGFENYDKDLINSIIGINRYIGDNVYFENEDGYHEMTIKDIKIIKRELEIREHCFADNYYGDIVVIKLEEEQEERGYFIPYNADCVLEGYEIINNSIYFELAKEDEVDGHIIYAKVGDYIEYYEGDKYHNATITEIRSVFLTDCLEKSEKLVRMIDN